MKYRIEIYVGNFYSGRIWNPCYGARPIEYPKYAAYYTNFNFILRYVNFILSDKKYWFS